MKKLHAWAILIITSLLISIPIHGVVTALSESEMQMYSQNNILFYDPSCSEAQNDNCVGLLPGDDNESLVWNYFVEAGIDGVSNNANVIAGIMGNFQQESGLNPFSAGSYHGLFQTNDASFMESMKKAGLDSYWGSTSAPKDAVEKAIKIELDWLTQNADRFKCTGDPTWQKTGFVCNIDDTANTPEAFSDLFLVSYEDAYTEYAESPHMGGSNAILDAHARQVGYDILGRYAYYQEASIRRANAKAIYDKNVSAVTCKGVQALVDTAKRLSWPVGARPANVYTATDDYDKAALARGDGYITASNCNLQSATGVCYSCSRYVSLALLESGIDQEFVEESKEGNHYKPHLLNMNPDGLTYYLVNSPKWQELTEYSGIGYDQLKPGDILLKDGEYGGNGDHVFFYLGDGIVAEASQEEFAAYQHEWGDWNNGFKAFRFKNSASSSANSSQNQGTLTSANLNDGGINSIMRAKNADKQYSDFIRPKGAINSGENIAYWDDYDSPEMLKALLEAYGDLAYQVGRAINIPWVGIIVQMRYEDPNSICGKNNFWGAGCPPGTPAGGASIWGDNLGDGFVEYAKALTNGYHNQALGIKDPKEFLVKLGPTWVQGNINGPGYGNIEGMKKSVDVIEDFIKTSEGQAIVKTFAGWSDDGKSACGSGATGTCFASQLKHESDGGCTEDGYTYYWQGGESWAKVPYACEYVPDAACGPSAMAMITTALTGKMVTPDESAAKATALGAAVCRNGSNDSVALVAKEYGLTVEPISETAEAINQALKQGKMIIASVGPESKLTTGGHFIGIRALTSSGKWKLFDSSTYYDGGSYQDINDMEFDPQFLANAMSVHTGGAYAISR